MTETTPERYAWWRAALAGEKPAVHENDPQCGFFYRRQKNKIGPDGPRLPVAIWIDDGSGQMLALIGFKGSEKLADAEDLWTWVCQSPVSEEAYRAAFDAGEWSDDPPALVPPPAKGSVVGDNLADDPADAMRQELEGELETAKPFLDKPIKTDDDANRAAVWAKRVGELAKRADLSRTTEKQPHLDASRAVDDRWRPIIDTAKELSSLLKRHIEPFLIAKRREADRVAREAAAEAQRLRDKAATAAEQDEPHAEERAEELSRQADVAERASVPKNASAGRAGARVALRTEKRARIVDYDACLAALKDHKEVRALVETLAQRAVRAGVPLAGVEVETIEKAA